MITETERTFHISPNGMGVLCALDQMNCSPSAYYGQPAQRLEYVVGYLSVKPNDRGALALHATYTMNSTFDDRYQDCLDVDSAQANEFDWRN